MSGISLSLSLSVCLSLSGSQCLTALSDERSKQIANNNATFYPSKVFNAVSCLFHCFDQVCVIVNEIVFDDICFGDQEKYVVLDTKHVKKNSDFCRFQFEFSIFYRHERQEKENETVSEG